MMRSKLFSYILRKVFRAVFTLLLLSTLVFFALRLSGNPARILLSPDAPPEMVAAYAERYGLNAPLAEQYVLYLRNLLSADFGSSYINSKPVAAIIIDRLPATLELGLSGIVLAIFIGIPLGLMAALDRSGPIDKYAMTLATLVYSVPSFFFGVLLMLLFSVALRWLPSSGSDTWRNLILPAMTLGIGNAALLARFTRSAVAEIMQQPYILAARARGTPRSRIIVHYLLPNAGIALLTVIGLMIGTTIVGAIVTETVFAWPGLGSLFVSSVSSRDIPVVQAIVILSAATMVTTNLTVDFLYRVADPRIRTAQR
ncbi:ABC transporter permease [Phyllobacterium chamaecytisi]|uniref:ABC transporter permease n=1 Tax=Phyllobacterium chamaecytisi TaxID=2876082 RepID=UPI001CC9D91F|nr:ABC transporter permease [Phyllobacterium sp. KW56]MBZ9602990.1 ABC transporter permease [Phyllobacterium sp. KW56]